MDNQLVKSITKLFEKFFEIFFTLLFSIIFFIIINYYWDRIPFLTDDFSMLIPIYNFSIVLGVVFSISKIFIKNKGYALVTNLVTNIVFLVIAYNLWILFPFDTSVIGNQNTWDIIFRGLILLPSIGVVIGSIAETIKVITNSK